MRKHIVLFLLALFSYTTTQAQKTTWSVNGNYRTEAKDFGVGTQVMIPIYKNLMIAPKVDYFFEKETNLDWGLAKSNIKHKSLNYGVDLHYAFFLKNSLSNISPFLGVEGMTSWSKISGTYTAIYPNSPGSTVKPNIEERDYDGSFNDTNVLGNIGIAGRWFVSDNIFINTQIKYVILFKETDDNHFVFTAGIGYAF